MFKVLILPFGQENCKPKNTEESYGFGLLSMSWSGCYGNGVQRHEIVYTSKYLRGMNEQLLNELKSISPS